MKKLRLSLLAVACLAAGWLIGWRLNRGRGNEEVQRIVAINWGDGKYGKAFYGAEVHLLPVAEGYSVRGRIWIGRGNDYFHDLGEIARVGTSEEAVAKWGEIRWAAEGLTIGPGDGNPFFVARTRIESHR